MNCQRCNSPDNLQVVKRRRIDNTYVTDLVCTDCIELRKRVERNRGTQNYKISVSLELAEIIERGKQTNSRLAAKYKEQVYVR